ncbi:MAG: RnfABCDGE type electron transport complex subunit A [Phycisphaerae bacterium]|jgi:electron transport complex protein RnfA|nr:RnfABCDGE type electron transport complex subunit A [Phycisphaerae bacterium]
MTSDLIFVFITAAIINNFIFKYFLGICPFLGVSKRTDMAMGMGFAVTFVMTVAGVLTWIIYHMILVPMNIQFLQYITFILVIAGTVQLVEMYVRKFFPNLYESFGIFLPMITTNCAILGACLFIQKFEYNLIQAAVFSLGGGLGFAMAITIMAGIREELNFSDVPRYFKGPAITLISAAILAMAFSGFLIKR